MKIKKIISLFFIFSVSATLLAQNYPVTLRVVDKTFGVRTSNDISQDEKNIVAGLSEELKFQGHYAHDKNLKNIRKDFVC